MYKRTKTNVNKTSIFIFNKVNSLLMIIFEVELVK